MKKDHLEQYIANHRDEFDLETPPLKSWYQIEKAMDKGSLKSRRFSIWKVSKIAAAVLFLLIAGGLIGSFLTQKLNNTSLSDAQGIEQIAPELQEVEHYYQQQLNQKVQQLAAYKEETAAVMKDLEENDRFLKELRKELLKAPKGTEAIVINNIIKTYQTKLEILERVLEHLEQSKIQKSEYHEINI